MYEPEIVTKRQRVRFMWKLGVLYFKPIPFIRERVNEIRTSIYKKRIEMHMMQRFIEDNQLDIPIESSRSSTDVQSESSVSTSMETIASSATVNMPSATGKRTKRMEINLEQRFTIAQHYLRWLADDILMNRRLSSAYINDLIASIENQDLTAKTLYNEINYMLSKVGPSVCFARLKPGEIPVRDRQMASEKFWTVVFVNDNKRDRNIRGTKLDNITLLQQIHKLSMVRKYEEQVDAAEFYRKLLENRSFPNEIDQLTNKRMRLLCRTGMVERETYNLRRHLEKRVVHGDKLRERIAKEKYLMARVEQSLTFAVAARDKEKKINDMRLGLLSDYTVPEVTEYIELTRNNVELKEIVKMWEKKVAVAKLIRDSNQQKWRRLTKQRPSIV